MKKRIALAILLLVLAGAFYFGGQSFFRKSQPDYGKNIILIVVDALRADHLSTYGYHRKTSPFIDRFAQTGSLFEYAFAPLPTTQPSFAGLMTSLYPFSHGVQRHGVALSHKAVTFPELLQNKGWETAAVVGASNLDTIFGFSQGFDFYEDHLGSKENLKVKKVEHRIRWQRRAKEVNQIVFQWLLNRNSRRPFFLMIHYYDPHHPYEAPPPYYRRFPADNTKESQWKASYDGEVNYVDAQFGRLYERFKEMGLLKNTLVILTSDHGENLGEHNWQGHSQRIHDEAVRIPLIFSGPTIPAGKRFSHLVLNVDIAPTILEYLNLPVPDLFQGVSLIPVFKKDRPVREFVYLEIAKRPDNFAQLTPDWQKYPQTQWAVRTTTEKLIWSSDGNHEFYNLVRDPLELNNIYQEQLDRAEQLKEMGRRFRNSYKTYNYASGPQRKKDDNDPDEALRALGYIN